MWKKIREVVSHPLFMYYLWLRNGYRYVAILIIGFLPMLFASVAEESGEVTTLTRAAMLLSVSVVLNTVFMGVLLLPAFRAMIYGFLLGLTYLSFDPWVSHLTEPWQRWLFLLPVLAWVLPIIAYYLGTWRVNSLSREREAETLSLLQKMRDDSRK